MCTTLRVASWLARLYRLVGAVVTFNVCNDSLNLSAQLDRGFTYNPELPSSYFTFRSAGASSFLHLELRSV